MLLQGPKPYHYGMGLCHMRDIYFHLPFSHHAPCKMVRNPIHAAISTEVLALCIERELHRKGKMKRGKDFSLGPRRTCTVASQLWLRVPPDFPGRWDSQQITTLLLGRKFFLFFFFPKWKFYQKYYQQCGNDIFHTGYLKNKLRPSNCSSWTLKTPVQQKWLWQYLQPVPSASLSKILFL